MKFFENNIFSPRTCVQPRLEFNLENELLINYKEQTIAISEKSDQGPACVNTVEAVYLASAIIAIFTGIGIVHGSLWPHVMLTLIYLKTKQ